MMHGETAADGHRMVWRPCNSGSLIPRIAHWFAQVLR